MKNSGIKAILFLSACTLLGTSHASNIRADILSRSDVQQFISKMTKEHNFDKKELQQLFSQVELRQDIIKAMNRPAEGMAWHKYRPIFLTEKRIQRGAEFINKHADTLARAEKTYGVPKEIITAIIGVETFYGRHKGKYRVMDSLSTLAFDYPKRSRFFTSELEHFLLMAREEKTDPLSMKGSYAGAMGQPQFISSSFRSYAIDFDNDGKRDLWENTDDVIGSVAYYLKAHGWKRNQTITSQVSQPEQRPTTLVKKGIKPHSTVAQLNKQGIHAISKLNKNAHAALIELEQKQGHEYWLGMKNFYVITRYNHSALYAMAVYQLGEEIKLRHTSLAQANNKQASQ